MKNLFVKLKDEIFLETERILNIVNKYRNRYINVAIEFYNRPYRRRLLSKQLIKESGLVSVESSKVLAEFEGLEDKN